MAELLLENLKKNTWRMRRQRQNKTIVKKETRAKI
jgi:hypothetical protein